MAIPRTLTVRGGAGHTAGRRIYASNDSLDAPHLARSVPLQQHNAPSKPAARASCPPRGRVGVSLARAVALAEQTVTTTIIITFIAVS